MVENKPSCLQRICGESSYHTIDKLEFVAFKDCMKMIANMSYSIIRRSFLVRYSLLVESAIKFLISYHLLHVFLEHRLETITIAFCFDL